MTGTGEKKCMPTKRARRASGSAAARRVMEIELVLLARTAVAGAAAATSREELALDLLVLEDGLDHELGAARRVGQRGRDGDPAELLRGAALR